MSLFLEEWSDAAFIFGVLLINAVIGTAQEYSAERSASALQELVTANTQVLRQGEAYEIDAREQVPGDLVLLEPGDRVPADLRLLDQFGLQLDESLLTGESLAVSKRPDQVLDRDTTLGDRANMAFAGTLVARGRGRGIVAATALGTELGQIAQAVEAGPPTKPPLLQRMERFAFRITLIASDKTGTLTLNELTARRLVLPDGSQWHISGEGIASDGGIQALDQDQQDASREDVIRRLAKAVTLANEGFLGHREGAWTAHGDAVDIALLVMARKAGLKQQALADAYPPLACLGFESERAYCATVSATASADCEHDCTIASVKGVEALGRNGHYVAVTGDGANDAPALREAHVGVAKGKKGTDVARDRRADRNRRQLRVHRRRGGGGPDCLRQCAQGDLPAHLHRGGTEIVLFTLALVSGLPLPLTAVQLLWLNLVINGIQDVALAFEKAEADELARPPRSPGETIFNRLMVERVLLSALAIGTLAFLTFRWLLAGGYGLAEARSGTLLLMVLFENVQVFNSRSETRSAFRHNLLSNPLLLFGTAAAQLVHIGAMYTLWLLQVLGVQPVSLAHWGQLLGIALSLLLVMELHKLLGKRLGRTGNRN